MSDPIETQHWVQVNVEERRQAYFREHGVDIAVVDDSDFVGFGASATRVGEIYMTDVKSMVANVLKKKGPHKIRRLDILDHGNELTLQIGGDTIGLHNQIAADYRKKIKDLSEVAPDLAKLRPEFQHWGFVHLQHCSIGNNKNLLIALSKLWNVSVFAGTGSHNPVYRFNFGDYVRADPNGAFGPSGRPDQDTYSTYIGMRPEENHPLKGSREPLSMSSRSVAYEEYPPPTDYYLENMFSDAGKAKTKDARDRIAVQLLRDFDRGVAKQSKLAKDLYARLSQKKVADKISMLFHLKVTPTLRAELLGVLHAKQ